MLKNRIVTASILAPLIILAVLKLPPLWFAVVWGVVIAVAAWEWTNLSAVVAIPGRVGFVAIIAGFMLSGPKWAGFALDWLPWVVVAWWFIVGVLLRRIPAKLLTIKYPKAFLLSLGGFVLISAWILMVWLRTNFGVMQVLYLMLLIWLADVAAYFAGKKWGHTKLSPEISPGKTVAGLYGAMIAVALFAVGIGVFKGFAPLMIFDFVMLSVVTVIISVVGDLFESLIKRVRGLKDSGSILPGHGGLLDRIDSLIAAVAVFYAGSTMGEIFLQ
ncbi:MAG TPA: phosphatidate cytidylyltransferase [Methylococcaceae bacterium]|jgi:phosphatidate cytidylyltransferase|nr:phosphatidate cytidylyltransferase [Methylococcaceae bacterium]